MYTSTISPQRWQVNLKSQEIFTWPFSEQYYGIFNLHPDDVKIVYNNFGVTTICFVCARLFVAIYALFFVLLATRPFTDCQGIRTTTSVSCLISMVTASFLFLRRLQAVHPTKWVVRWIFVFLWCGVVAASITATVIGTSIWHLEGTEYCIAYQRKGMMIINEFFPIAFDTLVFFAIACKLMLEHTHSKSDGAAWSSIFTGKSLPRFSRALLQGSQQHYIVVVGMTIASAVVMFTPSVPGPYLPVVTLVSAALAASMACRVFRNLKTLDLRTQASAIRAESRLSSARGLGPQPAESGSKEMWRHMGVNDSISDSLA